MSFWDFSSAYPQFNFNFKWAWAGFILNKKTASEACMAAKIVGKWCYVVYIGQNVHYRFSQKNGWYCFPNISWTLLEVVVQLRS